MTSEPKSICSRQTQIIFVAELLEIAGNERERDKVISDKLHNF